MSTAQARSVVFEAPYRIGVAGEPARPPQAGEIAVRTLVSAISPGTEMLFYRGQAPAGLSVDATIAALAGKLAYPLRYGYACVGLVEEVGAGVDPAWRGRQVFAFHPHTSRFVITPEQAIPVPDGLTPAQAALLPNMETAVNFVMDGQPLIGERVAVIGQGVVGLLNSALLARFPLERLLAVDRLAARRELACQLGAHTGLAAEDAAAQFGQGMDLIYEVSGNPAALDLAIGLADFAGRIVVGSWYGEKRAAIDLGGAFHRQRIRLISSQVSTLAPEHGGRWTKARRLEVAWRMLAGTDVAHLITHRFPVEDAAAAYALIDQHPEQTVQVLLTYPT
jgi:2-desacetyl-2-hydroxyethyl bacteriochlorophyllide A dehydrogenase